MKSGLLLLLLYYFDLLTEVFRPLPDPVIETHPTPVSIERGKSADFCCISRGEGISYTWYKNDRPIKGKRGRKLEIMSVTIEDEALYHCVVGNGTLTVCSRKAKLSVGEFYRTG